MWAAPESAPIAAGKMRGDFVGGASSMFFMALEKVIVDDLGNNPGSGSGSFTPLSEILTICFSCAD